MPVFSRLTLEDSEDDQISEEEVTREAASEDLDQDEEIGSRPITYEVCKPLISYFLNSNILLKVSPSF